MIWPGVMAYSTINLGVWITRTLCTKLPYRPVFAMCAVKEFDETIGWIAVGSLGIGRGWAGRHNDYEPTLLTNLLSVVTGI